MLLFNVFILFIYCFSASACPRPEALYPCICNWDETSDNYWITCDKLENNQDLITAAKSLIGKNYILSFSIRDSVFTFISSDTFKGLKFAELEIKNSTLMALTDSDFAFEGLEDHLETFRMDSCVLLSEWSWSVLSKLKNLKILEIKRGVLEDIEDLGKIKFPVLRTVDFSYNRISFIHDEAFASSNSLKYVNLKNNEISTLKRTMFPNPASSLAGLNFSYNKIEQLPGDIFSNMPFLRVMDLGHNEILVLSEAVFKPVWDGLAEFHALGNELRCDCRLTWILKMKKPQIIDATCAMPQPLRGKSLSSLKSKDLWCI